MNQPPSLRGHLLFGTVLWTIGLIMRRQIDYHLAHALHRLHAERDA